MHRITRHQQPGRVFFKRETPTEFSSQHPTNLPHERARCRGSEILFCGVRRFLVWDNFLTLTYYLLPLISRICLSEPELLCYCFILRHTPVYSCKTQYIGRFRCTFIVVWHDVHFHPFSLYSCLWVVVVVVIVVLHLCTSTYPHLYQQPVLVLVETNQQWVYQTGCSEFLSIENLKVMLCSLVAHSNLRGCRENGAKIKRGLPAVHVW